MKRLFHLSIYLLASSFLWAQETKIIEIQKAGSSQQDEALFQEPPSYSVIKPNAYISSMREGLLFQIVLISMLNAIFLKRKERSFSPKETV